jgi:hypothetical protein
LIVVAAAMPSLILLSRTQSYSWLRITGAGFASAASLGWIAERLLGVHNAVNAVVDGIAHKSIWIAGALFLISLVCWLFDNNAVTQATGAKHLSRPAFKRT